jgi:type III secretion system FlhB-like substrate exporter
MRRCNIKRPVKKASALSYEPADLAPRIAASGRDREAERIIALARSAGIEIVEDPVLAALLNDAKPGDYIPSWCWEAVAKILAFVLKKER